MSKLLPALGSIMVSLSVKIAFLAVIVGLGYGIWRFGVLFLQCGPEIKVIVMTIAGVLITVIVLFVIAIHAKDNRAIATEIYRRKIDVYGRLLPLIVKMFHAGKGHRLLLPERDKEQLNAVMLELGILVDDVQVDRLGDFRQELGNDDIPLHERFYMLERLLRDIREDLEHRDAHLDGSYCMNRLWIDHYDKMIKMMEDLPEEKS